MTLTLPLNLFTFTAFAIGFIYFATRIGSKDHTGWLGSAQMWMVVSIVVLLLCLGYDASGIWHLLIGWTGH